MSLASNRVYNEEMRPENWIPNEVITWCSLHGFTISGYNARDENGRPVFGFTINLETPEDRTAFMITCGHLFSRNHEIDKN